MATQEQIEGKINKDVAGALVLQGTGGAVSIVPKDMAECMEFAKMMAIAGSCIRKDFRNQPGQCLMLTMQALRWGMDPFAVANKAFIVNDQISFESQLINAVVNERANLEGRLKPVYKGEGGKRKCIITGRIKGEVDACEYISPEIAAINPKNSPLWKTDPDQQLFYYSVRAWARRYVPEVMLGVYDREEVEHVGADNAKDVSPIRPGTASNDDAHAEEAFQLYAADGGDMGFFNRSDFVGNMVGGITGCPDDATLLAFWEFNEDAVAQLGGARDDSDRKDITRIYNERRQELKGNDDAEAEPEREEENAAVEEVADDVQQEEPEAEPVDVLAEAKKLIRSAKNKAELDDVWADLAPRLEDMNPKDVTTLSVYYDAQSDQIEDAA